MRNTDCRCSAGPHFRGIGRILVILFLTFSALSLIFTCKVVAAEDSKNPVILPAPSAGKAIVCIYRTYRFTGSASHDELFVNDTHVGKLLNSEYAFTEVEPGTVIIGGMTKMYYGSAVMSAGAALNQARQKQDERARFEAEAGKTYYFKWTAGAMATMIKVTPKRSANFTSPSHRTTRKNRNPTVRPLKTPLRSRRLLHVQCNGRQL